MRKLLPILILMLFAVSAQAAISPSQVLVLYNADWREDHPLTDPGQDSREIAEHYQRMHTDPVTGERPYLLGLRCRHGIRVVDESRHLNETHLEEKSSDNKAGVVLAGGSRLFGAGVPDDQLRDSRTVEFTLPGGAEGWRLETLRVEINPAQGGKIRVIDDGQVATPGQVTINPGKDWTLRLDARSYAAGPLKVEVSCDNAEGKRSRWEASFVDHEQAQFSRTGRDGVRDDQHFLEDVALPVKAFLEDPANARPDGTLLKDHILFIVVGYGLPRTSVATYGISRGVTNRLSDHGGIIDFGQRLQLLYYDEEKVMGTAPRPHRFAGKDAFSDFFLRAPQAWPLVELSANPFVHPLAYAKKLGTLDDQSTFLAFTTENRAKFPERHLYFVMRIDGADPLQARALIDRAAYARRYAGPAMGRLEGVESPRTNERVGKLNTSSAGPWLWDKGFRHLYHGGAARNRLELFRLDPEDGFLNTEPAYLPGGIAATVISGNGWGSDMKRDVERGVTATLGVAQVYKGAPHIHNKSWWDDEILYPALWRGNTLGEALLMNQMHLGWIATFVGDPLYRLPSAPAQPPAPRFDPERDVRVHVERGEKGREVWLAVDLGGTPEAPQTAQLRAVAGDGREVICQTFEARPYVKLGSAKDVCGATWQVEIMDPFGRRWSEAVPVECSR